MSTSDTNSRLTVSEDRIRALLAEFRLDLVNEFEKFATNAAMEMLDARVKILELWQANIVGQTTNQRRVSDRALAWAALTAALIGSAATLIWLNHS